MADSGILTAAELASVRREYRGASLLPARTYHDPAIFDWERARILRRDWVMVAREEEVAEPGTYLLVELDRDPLIVIRGRDSVLRAFHNVCRHRGTAVSSAPSTRRTSTTSASRRTAWPASGSRPGRASSS